MNNFALVTVLTEKGELKTIINDRQIFEVTPLPDGSTLINFNIVTADGKFARMHVKETASQIIEQFEDGVDYTNAKNPTLDATKL